MRNRSTAETSFHLRRVGGSSVRDNHFVNGKINSNPAVGEQPTLHFLFPGFIPDLRLLNGLGQVRGVLRGSGEGLRVKR